MNRWTLGAGGALAMVAASFGTQPQVEKTSALAVPMAPALTARSLERAPLVRIRNMDGSGHLC